MPPVMAHNWFDSLQLLQRNPHNFGLVSSLGPKHGYSATCLRLKNSQKNGLSIENVLPKKNENRSLFGVVEAIFTCNYQGIIFFDYFEKVKNCDKCTLGTVMRKIKLEYPEK